MSGKRNNLEDFFIVQVQGAGPLGLYNGQLDAGAPSVTPPAQHLLHSAQDQLLCGASFVRRAAPQLAVKRVGNIHGGSHKRSIPYLWSIGCHVYGCLETWGGQPCVLLTLRAALVRPDVRKEK